jgi:succinyl-CoA synthetase beta subunit
MYLHQHQSKQYFERFGIPVLPGRAAAYPHDAFAAASEFNAPVTITAQLLTNERIVRRAETAQEAENIAREMFAMEVEGVRIRLVLVEPAVETDAEFFLGMYGNLGRSLLLFASTEGGSDLSRIERERPDTLFRETIDPFIGVLEFQSRNLASGINLPRECWGEFSRIAASLYRCALATDAIRAEINPLGLTRTGELIMIGGRLVIDDNALFRQRELAALRDVQAEHPTSVQARMSAITYVHLPGQTGCIVSGAGLGMATMDLLEQHRAPASSFLDLGSDIRRDKVSSALQLILPEARAVLFNIFADRAPCDEIAAELIAAFAEIPVLVPLVVRLAGQQADAANELLRAAALPNLLTAATTSEAVHLVASSGA